MPKTPEELEKMYSELEVRQEKSEKEFQLKLQTAERNTLQYKELAEKNEETLRTFKQDAEKRDKEQKETLAKARESEISEFVESQVKAGKMLPAYKEKVITFMKSLTSESTVMEFTENDGSKRSHTQVSLFKELMLKMMKPVMPVNQEYSLAERAEAEDPEGLNEQPVETFMEVIDKGQKKKLPIDGAEEAAKAFEYQDKMAKSGRPVTYEQALIAVSPRKSAVKA